MDLKQTLKRLAPPVLVDVVRQWREAGRQSEWETVAEGWRYASTHPEVRGWNVDDVLAVYAEKWPKFKAMVDGHGPLGVDHESQLAFAASLAGHNAIMTFAYVLARAAHKRDKLSLLDWGGGIGHYCLLAQALLPDVEIDYVCKDLPKLAEYGAQLLPAQHFVSDDRCFLRTYDLVMASTSLHYAQEWQRLVARLSRAASGYLYLARMPIVQRAPSFVFVQRPYAYGYNTEYLGWCLNQAELVAAVTQNEMTLMREFVYGHAPVIRHAPEQNAYRGYLFVADAAKESR